MMIKGGELIWQEEAVAEAYDEIKKSRSRFRSAAASLTNAAPAGGNSRVYDAANDQH